MPYYKYEHAFFRKGYDEIIGVDEVGMGCLAGPVAVCAVYMPRSFDIAQYPELRMVKDSKMLSASQRERLALAIKESGIEYAIRLAYPKTIDRLNIFQASRQAMKRAVSGVLVRRGGPPMRNVVVLVDGPHKIPGLAVEQMPIVKGDQKVFAIACASILAKVYRDRMMRRYAKKYPQYGFEKHMGYGTKYHQAQLASIGPCDIHRRSFRPVSTISKPA